MNIDADVVGFPPNMSALYLAHFVAQRFEQAIALAGRRAIAFI
ncbi:hypothetical protein [Anabaena azotica]|nr:hypothetical protein [Anabaena azotica]